jgi:hypothetical protein
MDEPIALGELRERRRDHRRASHGNAFLALADQLEGAGSDLRDVVAAMLMASVSLLVEAAEPEEARRMAEGVAKAYPEMVETLLRSRAKG